MNETEAETAEAIVFVVDDDGALREYVASAICSAGIACRAFPSAQAFLDALASIDWNVGGCLVLNARLRGMSGLDLQDTLMRMGVEVPIMFVSRFGDIPTAVRAMKSGATDYLPVPVPREELLGRITAALDADAGRRGRRRKRAEIRTRMATLSPREAEVFEKVAAGQANREVAADLGISVRTVEIHRARVMKKMMAKNLAELVLMKVALDVVSQPVNDP